MAGGARSGDGRGREAVSAARGGTALASAALTSSPGGEARTVAVTPAGGTPAGPATGSASTHTPAES